MLSLAYFGYMVQRAEQAQDENSALVCPITVTVINSTAQPTVPGGLAGTLHVIRVPPARSCRSVQSNGADVWQLAELQAYCTFRQLLQDGCAESGKPHTLHLV